MPASRSVVSVLLRALGDFSLHPQGRPCGRPPAAAVLGRQQNDGHREPASPSHYRISTSLEPISWPGHWGQLRASRFS